MRCVPLIADACVWLNLSLSLVWLSPARGDDKPTDPATAAFTKLDADGDKRLTIEEHRSLPGNPRAHDRDFRLFDLDGDGNLTRDEFAAIPGRGSPSLRGALPDPFDDLLDAAVAAMDEAYGGWDKQPNQAVESQSFVINFLASISPDGTRRFDQALVPLADPDSNGRVTRDEAKRFLEIQLGIRAPTGTLLREPSGRFVVWSRFLSMDADRNNVLSKEEFLAKWGPTKPEENFVKGDRDKSGDISPEEFAHPNWAGYDDPVAIFLRTDTDFDGLLSPAEISTGTPEYSQAMVPLMFPAFDDDGDGRISLTELRVSMLGNRIASWTGIPTDANRSKTLTFDEFTFNQGQFALLRRLYFHRFDANGDGSLTSDEYPFKKLAPNSFHAVASDGSGFRQLFRSEDYPTVGSPAVSPDGKSILCDIYPEGKILLMTFEGQNVRVLCDALMPTWSPDGKQFACSRYTGGSAVWIMNIDGSEHKRLDEGWGAQWSPDGKTIAYTKNNTVWAWDVATGQSREVLPAGGHGYLTVYYNMNWSPDSRRLVFRGAKEKGSDVASIAMTGDDPDLRVHATSETIANSDFGWSPDGQRIFFNMKDPAINRNQLYQVAFDGKSPPTPLPGWDPKFTYTACTVSPDGQWIVAVTRE
jgi:TolB protein